MQLKISAIARITGMQLRVGQVGLDVEMWLEMRFSGVEVAHCINVDVWRSCSCVRLALSNGQEMAAVSAVSLTANEFPGGGVVCVGVDGCLNARGDNRGKTEGKRRKKIEPQGCSGNLCTPSFKASKQEGLLSQCIWLKLPAHCTELSRNICDKCYYNILNLHTLKSHGYL